MHQTHPGRWNAVTIGTSLAAAWRALGLTVDAGDLAGWDTAVFSTDRAYRYVLTRTWSTEPGRVAVWVMLNPSTADAFTADPTARRCRGFAQRWGCRGMAIVNLFGLRATDPAVMLTHPDPVGPVNDAVLKAVAADPELARGLWIAGWGAHGAHRDRSRGVSRLLDQHGVQLWTVGVTKAGQPRHPLYAPADAPLTRWPGSCQPRSASPGASTRAY
jgi:hypothetical protein